MQASEVDDVPLLRAGARPGTANGLKTAGSGSLSVACPEERRRWVLSLVPHSQPYNLNFYLLWGTSLGEGSTVCEGAIKACSCLCRAVPVRELLWRMRWHSASLFLCFAVTIAVFPSITSSICSVHNPARRPPCLPHTPYGRLAGDSVRQQISQVRVYVTYRNPFLHLAAQMGQRGL